MVCFEIIFCFKPTPSTRKWQRKSWKQLCLTLWIKKKHFYCVTFFFLKLFYSKWPLLTFSHFWAARCCMCLLAGEPLGGSRQSTPLLMFLSRTSRLRCQVEYICAFRVIPIENSLNGIRFSDCAGHSLPLIFTEYLSNNSISRTSRNLPLMLWVLKIDTILLYLFSKIVYKINLLEMATFTFKHPQNWCSNVEGLHFLHFPLKLSNDRIKIKGMNRHS